MGSTCQNLFSLKSKTFETSKVCQKIRLGERGLVIPESFGILMECNEKLRLNFISVFENFVQFLIFGMVAMPLLYGALLTFMTTVLPN